MRAYSNGSSLSISKSGFVSYLFSPLEFKKRFIDKIPFPQTPEMRKGFLFHKLIERYVRYKKMEDNPEVPQEWVDRAVNFINTLELDFLETENKRVHFVDIESVNVRLVGIIDGIARIKGKEYIVEWKTGEEREYHKWDISFYSFLLKFENIDIDTGIIYYPSLDMYKIYKVEDDDLQFIKNKLREIVLRYQNNNWEDEINV